MKNTMSLMAIAMLITACGSGPLYLNRNQAEGKTYTFMGGNPYPLFTEKTFGDSLAKAAANSLVQPATRIIKISQLQPKPVNKYYSMVSFLLN